MEIELNKWEQHLTHWCPAQMYYYCLDSKGGEWCIYFRWDGQQGDDPWQAELFHCDDDWEFKWDCERVDLLEEKEHTPGIVTGFYRDDESPFLMEKVLERAKGRFLDLVFPNNS